jgi:hypothetical protein
VSPSDFIAKPTTLLIPDDQKTFKRQNSQGYEPSNVWNRIRDLCATQRKIPNDRLSEPGRIPAIQSHGLQTDQPFADTFSTRKSIGNQDVGQTGKKADRRSNFAGSDDNEQID